MPSPSTPLSHPLAVGEPGRPLAVGEPGRPLAWRDGQAVDLATFIAHVHGLAQSLPDGRHAVNLCEDRYRFMVAFYACAVRGQVSLLPSSRAPAVVGEVQARHADAYCLGDLALELAPPRYWQLPADLPRLEGPVPMLADDALVAIGFTSGSTGAPQPNPKTWGSFLTSTRQDLVALQSLWAHTDAVPHVVATVPPQHMYGMELSVLLPMVTALAVHAGRPFFPDDVARALAEIPEPRVLVTTPVHLRALVESGVHLPPLVGIVSATAPLAQEVAAAAEARFGGEVREMFGSTETCVFAVRRTAVEAAWTPLPGVRLESQAAGTLVHAPHLASPVLLADMMDVAADGRFQVRGRQADLLEIAGKRASLADLTRRLLAVPGVVDGTIVQLAPEHGQSVGRIAALVVAPSLDEAQILTALRGSFDPVFLPRRLRKLAALPRNETGKLPRDLVLGLLSS
ncbi:xanthomonadin biosynthesis 3-hydroxybenozate--AMP ligase XanA2 [Xanthomonas campestris]|uniref:xanthomonadin biosynthesis 3-hydroxybenozate--AMP ligase XanA2 n=1 Tax=Xanthomonas campestris TaxID=339 RepID=UPI002B235138|nr:xanthomonadin biosynthesis 3-hydroxybenozate--AMP ligase XanA2 [Xanthomonas campestris]MEA9727104.1 xanthomonadin biosynthesis 3-hydroxybenozate--AMP ligase XanA2 [Xanthomonas campestris pv. raphani]